MSEQQLNQKTEVLRDRIGASYQWSYDDRFDALLSEYSIEDQLNINNILQHHFADCWDQVTITSADDELKKEAGMFSQLRDGQLLYTTAIGSNSHLMAAVWPWGDGKTVSLRIRAPE